MNWLTKSVLCFLAVLMFASANTQADVFKPAYLDIEQVSDEQFDITWRAPSLDIQNTLRLSPVFPDNTRVISDQTRRHFGGATVMHWRITVPEGLEGTEVTFDGLETARTDIIIRYKNLLGDEQFGRAHIRAPSFYIEPASGNVAIPKTYLKLGFEHILGGFDHLLFVLALVLIVQDKKRLFMTITAFTIAHSITLSLSTLDFIQVPSTPTEAVIALSIVFVALEIVQAEQGKAGLTTRMPWLVALVFGLLHGFGFAGALQEIGLPESSIPAALLFFNIGVELGQISFVCLLLLIGYIIRAAFIQYDTKCPLRLTTGYLIGFIASFWLIERVVSFWV